MTTIGIVFIIVIYFIGILVSYNSIYNELEKMPNYWNQVSSVTMENYVRGHYKMMATYLSLIFPLYLGMKLGYEIGDKIYDIVLIDNEDENRVIAWLF